MTLLYILFIAPLEQLMTFVLSWGYAVVESYGWAIVILSLVVNVALLPIYAVAEGWQDEERGIRRRMAPKEREIRSAFKGQEQRAMLRTLQRQSAYTQLLPLRSSIGFLLQIPFFFAAYHLLSHADYLRGVSFGFLPDLGAPDRSFEIGGAGINLLPIIMTVINLISAFVYTQNLTMRDKAQLYGLSLVFLVALYESPVALTLYWTLNNAFSLVKNVVYARKEQWRSMAAGVRFSRQTDGMSGKWNLTGRFRSVPVWAEVAVFAAALLLARLSGLKGGEEFHSVLRYGVAVVLGILVLLNVMRAARPGRVSVLERVFLFGIAGGLGFLSYSVAVNSQHLLPYKDIVRGIAVLFVLRILPPVVGRLRRTMAGRMVENAVGAHRGKMFAGAVLMAGVTVFLYAPVLFYASDTASFSNSFSDTLAGLVCLLWVFVLSVSLVYRFCDDETRSPFAVCILLGSVFAVVYTFIFTGDYGVLSDFEVEKKDNLYVFWNYIYDAGIVFLVLTAFYFVCRKGWISHLCSAVFLVGLSVFGVFCIESMTHLESKTSLTSGIASAAPPSYNDTLLAFSKTEKNVVVLLVDMFTGDHLEQLVKMEPDLSGKLSGFVWYRDTLSTGVGTLYALQSVHGGSYYSMKEISERSDETYQEAWDKSYSVLTNFFSKQGYSVSWVGTSFSEPADIARHFDVPADVVVGYEQALDDYFPVWKERTGFEASVGQEWPFLAMSGLFRAAPYSLRAFVYQHGRWNLGNVAAVNAAFHTARTFSVLDSLATSSNTGSTRGTFKYFHLESSHVGNYFSPADGKPTGDLQQFDIERDQRKYGEISNRPAHIYGERATLHSVIRWMEWMRENDVYDNTRLIIVADHGTWDSQTLYDAIGSMDPDNRSKRPEIRNPGMAYPLLLVKDFGSSGPLRISDALMTNADAADLAVAGIGVLPPQYRGDIGKAGTGERVRYLAAGGSSAPDMKARRQDVSIYRVTGSMFDRKNWEKIK